MQFDNTEVERAPSSEADHSIDWEKETRKYRKMAQMIRHLVECNTGYGEDQSKRQTLADHLDELADLCCDIRLFELKNEKSG